MRQATAALAFAALALQACSNQNDSESADEFAERVGAGDTQAAAPAATATAAVTAAPPAGTDVLALEQLGDISAVDLGPRDGGCTFSNGGTELLIAGAPNDPTRAGRGVVRVGGTLYLLASAGGLAAIRNGTRFNGEGITVDVRGSGQSSVLQVTDTAGRSKAVPGSWICT